jgi:hypothetical protein
MGIWLHGWDGDAAGKLVGRQPNTLIVALTTTDGDYAVGFASYDKVEAYGTSWYKEIDITCLTPGTHDGVVIGADVLDAAGAAYSLAIAEMDWGPQMGAQWEEGVHLFSVRMQGNNMPMNRSGTLATAVIDASVTRITPPPEQVGWYYKYHVAGVGH